MRLRCLRLRVGLRLAVATGLLLTSCRSPFGGAGSGLGPDAPTGDPWYRAGEQSIAEASALAPRIGRARNVILFVGDGMGISTVTAARIFEGQLRGEPGEENLLAFEQLPHVALSKTYNTNQQVPDSAGTMTAIMSGVKTRAGVLGLSAVAGRRDVASVAAARVPTLLEQAERRGLATGIISTARITHATPAACYAHVPERDWEADTDLSEAARAADLPDIARQLVEFSDGDGIDVVLGGGRRNFLPNDVPDPENPRTTGRRGDGRNLVREWEDRFADATWIWNRDQLLALDPDTAGHVLGLFDASHMDFEYDRPSDPGGEPSLAEMTSLAIEILARDPDGFFLMVEGGRIDHAHHVGNSFRALTDTVAFSDAVRVALERTSREDTLVVVTADHSHVFTLGGYATRGNPILGVVRENAPETGEPEGEPARDGLGLPYTTLGYANGPGYAGASDAQREGRKQFPHSPRSWSGVRAGRPDLTGVDTAAPSFMQEATVPITRETHAGEDVAIYAGGPGAALFHGVHEQSYIYHVMVTALGWTR